MIENAEVCRILARAIDALVDAAYDAGGCKHADNPAWHDTMEALDDASDTLRDLYAGLQEKRLAQAGAQDGATP